MAAARAALLEVLTDEAYERTAALGAMLADGIERLIGDAGPADGLADVGRRDGLPWVVQRLYARSGPFFCARLPRSAGEWDADEGPALNGCCGSPSPIAASGGDRDRRSGDVGGGELDEASRTISPRSRRSWRT